MHDYLTKVFDEHIVIQTSYQCKYLKDTNIFKVDKLCIRSYHNSWVTKCKMLTLFWQIGKISFFRKKCRNNCYHSVMHKKESKLERRTWMFCSISSGMASSAEILYTLITLTSINIEVQFV